MPRYTWIPKVPAYFPQSYSPPKQLPLPPGLRFRKMDVIFEKTIDWWANDAPYPYVDPRDLTKKARETTTDPKSVVNAEDVDKLPQEVDAISVEEDLNLPDESQSVNIEVSKQEKRRLDQKIRRNTESGRITQHQRRNFQRYAKKNAKKYQYVQTNKV
ncbi:unnamed protein product [Allacma fusca]|uniref:Uncharacterized protein n=1 Tax=Allacma fusca TaxID=39272 RepID=A0A8J2KHC5_9HEXA|nr:unnamed protein product [Allacma fusca]